MTFGGNDQTQANFQETPYQDATWEVVGEVHEETEFAPLELTNISTSSVAVDPMFADYGGIAPPNVGTRWHLPDHLAHEARREVAPVEQGPPKIELTEDQLAAIRLESEQAGRLAALEEATAANVHQLEVFRGRIETILLDMSRQTGEATVSFEQQSIHLALAIAQKIIGATVEINPEYILPIVQKALGHAGSAVVKRVRVSAQDLEFIQVIGVGKELRGPDQQWEFVADDQVKAGCIIETSAGDVDFEVEHAFERVKNQVVKVLR
jgi:flagellar biosynthesis/type III secretory pathway protein FliH